MTASLYTIITTTIAAAAVGAARIRASRRLNNGTAEGPVYAAKQARLAGVERVGEARDVVRRDIVVVVVGGVWGCYG